MYVAASFDCAILRACLVVLSMVHVHACLVCFCSRSVRRLVLVSALLARSSSFLCFCLWWVNATFVFVYIVCSYLCCAFLLVLRLPLRSFCYAVTSCSVLFCCYLCPCVCFVPPYLLFIVFSPFFLSVSSPSSSSPSSSLSSSSLFSLASASVNQRREQRLSGDGFCL